MLKKIFLSALAIILYASAFAQDTSYANDSVPVINNVQLQNKKQPFQFKHYFIGGNLIAGFGNGGGAFGINPTIGYSLNQYVDVGVALNTVYNYQKYYDNEKQHTWNIGIAPFVRFFPISFLFFDASFEYNFVSAKYFYSDGTTIKQHWNVPSIIGSVGYMQRVYGQSYFFISIGMDFLTNNSSPYREQYYDINGMLRSKAQPIIRTGFGINLW